MFEIALQQLDWTAIGAQFAESNYAITPPLLSGEDCDAIAAFYLENDRFRSTMLDRPGVDFTGGELVLVENRPRQQSRVDVVPFDQGRIAILPMRERPRLSKRGIVHSTLRHGVSPVRSGLRRALGILFHDAA